MAFLKQASLKISEPETNINSWVRREGMNVRTASNKIIEFKKIIPDFNPDTYLLTHCTIVASVNVEKADKPVHFGSEKTKQEYKKLAGRKDYWITPDTSKYMNANGDSWSRELLKASYKTFVGAENYVEHVQDPSLSKGKILDAALREVDGGKSLFADILVATNKKHKDLVNKIKTGQLQTLSMGSVVAFTICSQCGRVATDETELCHHIKFLKKNHFISENDGKKRITAELCGHYLYPESNKFIEGSWVETPAFKGAVMRNEIAPESIDKEAFIAKYGEILQMKNPELTKEAARIINAFKIVDSVSEGFNKSAQDENVDEEPADETPVDEEESDQGEEIPETDVDLPEEDVVEEPTDEEVENKEEIPETDVELDEQPADDTVEEDAPADAEVPEEIQDMGEPPEGEETPEEEALDEQAEKPYEILKNEIKQQLKDQIKKELLKDLGIEVDKTPEYAPSGLSNINLNDNLVRGHYNNIRKACKIAKEDGLHKVTDKRYALMAAKLSRKYSINNDIFSIVNKLDERNYVTKRRFAKKVEEELGRELKLAEKNSLYDLLSDLYYGRF